MSKRYEICLAGSGGQGVITAAVMAGEAASLFAKDLYAVQTQSYGPAARGGSAKAEVVISDAPIDYPKPVAPDLLIALTTDAAKKYAADVKKGGVLILDSFGVEGDFSHIDAKVYSLPLIETARDKIGKEIVTNMIALGMVAAILEKGELVSVDAMRAAMLDRVPKGTEELNAKAFEEGYRMFPRD